MGCALGDEGRETFAHRLADMGCILTRFLLLFNVLPTRRLYDSLAPPYWGLERFWIAEHLLEESMSLTRCARCILPENYPGINFNADGGCNYCLSYTAPTYQGDEALREKIQSFLDARSDRNASYDCVVGLSGGRDSSYLLYYFVKVLGFRIVAYCADNGFIPEQTKLNMKNMTDLLDVELVIEEHDYQTRCIKQHIGAWMKRPSPGMVGMLCTGCRLAMDVELARFVNERNIPVLAVGTAPFDRQSFKKKILSRDPAQTSSTALLQGYVSEVAANPRWIVNPVCLTTQLQEFYHHYYHGRLRRRRLENVLAIAPFDAHVRWEETEIVSKIEDELNWMKHPGTESTWRGDCDIALLKLYLYKKTLGYNDKDEGLSFLVRDGQINRDEAVSRLEKEGDISDELIEELFWRLGLSFSELQAALTG